MRCVNFGVGDVIAKTTLSLRPELSSPRSFGLRFSVTRQTR